MSDDLNDYDVSADDIFNPKRTEPTASAQNVTAIKSKDQDLGLEEIQVTKKRAPVAKLDEDRYWPRNQSEWFFADGDGKITFSERNTKVTEDNKRTPQIQGQGSRGTLHTSMVQYASDDHHSIQTWLDF